MEPHKIKTVEEAINYIESTEEVVLQELPVHFRLNKEIALEACKQNPYSFYLLSKEQKSDPVFCMNVIMPHLISEKIKILTYP